MNLSTLSDEILVSTLEKLTGNERAVTLQVLEHLVEFDKRGLFRELGYSSLFTYCTGKLNYSESSAYRRISAARCLENNPELGELFLEGKVTLCSIAAAANSIKAKVTNPEDIVGKSKREVQCLLAHTEPVAAKPRELVKPIVVNSFPLLPEIPREERYELRFSVTKEVYTKLEEAKNRLSNSLEELSLEAVLEKLLKSYLIKGERKGKDSSDTRYIPKSVRRAVTKRDSCQCSYKAPDGTRCTEKKYLQFDHIVPFACGGKSELENLRLLCPAHNRLMAEKIFGKEFMQSANYFHRWK